MEPIVVKGRLDFTGEETKQYSGEFEATLEESAAFDYGNHTAVTIHWGVMANGKRPQDKYLDTRYDTTIKRNKEDFKIWLQKYFENNFCEHILTIYQN